MELCESEVIQRSADTLAESHHRAHGMMRLTKRKPFAHEIVREIGGQQGGIRCGASTVGSNDHRVRHHSRHQPNTGPHRIHGIEESFLVFLQIAIVGHRQTFQEGQQRDQIPHHSSRLASRQLRDIRIFLLRHERRSRRVGIGNLNEGKLRARPENHIFREAREVDGKQSRVSRELHHEIAITHRIHRVLSDSGLAVFIHELEQACDQLAVDRHRGPCDCTAPQWTLVQAPVRIVQTATIPFEHFHVGEQVMREVDRLRTLEMGITGNHHVRELLAQSHQRALKTRDLVTQRADLVSQPEPDVQCDLVVPRTGSMQLRPGGDTSRELRLDIHVHILELGLPSELPRLDLHRDLIQAVEDFFELLDGEHSNLAQHGRVRLRALDIVKPQPMIERNRLGKPGNVGRRPACEPSTAGNR